VRTVQPGRRNLPSPNGATRVVLEGTGEDRTGLRWRVPIECRSDGGRSRGSDLLDTSCRYGFALSRARRRQAARLPAIAGPVRAGEGRRATPPSFPAVRSSASVLLTPRRGRNPRRLNRRNAAPLVTFALDLGALEEAGLGLSIGISAILVVDSADGSRAREETCRKSTG